MYHTATLEQCISGNISLELLSDIHKEKDITIVGMAAGKDDAVVMLRRMIDDLYHKGKLKDITTYFCGEDK